MKGVVFDIKRFAVHDGEGIRSTIFLKGCPLRCAWCHNPEGLEEDTPLEHALGRCMLCGICVRVCSRRALVRIGSRIEIDHDRCVGCGVCVEACPTNALRFSGWRISAEEAAEQLLRDRVFFGQSGGVTLSGGEALAQFDFSIALLTLLKREGVDTAVETCLMMPEINLAQTLGLIDHYLVDIKLIDSLQHVEMTGAPNQRILDNYRFLVREGTDVLVRIPLIPGYTATEENVGGIARFVAGVAAHQRVELLNYNPLGKSKYASLGQRYPVEGEPLTAEEMSRYHAILEREGLRAIKE